jgi:hypothetical protein
MSSGLDSGRVRRRMEEELEGRVRFQKTAAVAEFVDVDEFVVDFVDVEAEAEFDADFVEFVLAVVVEFAAVELYTLHLKINRRILDLCR